MNRHVLNDKIHLMKWTIEKYERLMILESDKKLQRAYKALIRHAKMQLKDAMRKHDEETKRFLSNS